MELHEDGLSVVPEQGCAELLARGLIGRIGVTMGALPVILPVNYAMLDGDIVFATSEGTKLRAAANHAVVAFEVDEVNPDDRSGWSVLVVGPAREITDPGEITRAQALGLRPWAGGHRERFIRVRTELVSGRVIGNGQPAS